MRVAHFSCRDDSGATVTRYVGAVCDLLWLIRHCIATIVKILSVSDIVVSLHAGTPRDFTLAMRTHGLAFSSHSCGLVYPFIS